MQNTVRGMSKSLLSRTCSRRRRDHVQKLENGLRGETRLRENHCSLDRSTSSIMVFLFIIFSLSTSSIRFNRIPPDSHSVCICIRDCKIYTTYLNGFHPSGALPRMNEPRGWIRRIQCMFAVVNSAMTHMPRSRTGLAEWRPRQRHSLFKDRRICSLALHQCGIILSVPRPIR